MEEKDIVKVLSEKYNKKVQVIENISSKMLSENSITPTLKIQFHFVSFSLFVKILKNSVLIFSIAILRIAVC